VPPPSLPPLGLTLARASRQVSRAFDEALGDAGGSLPVWLVLLNVTIRPTATQRELAAAVGVREATLTHHLNAMESAGLVTRRRDEANRRVHIVELTDSGRTTFRELRRAAQAFDRRLRRGISAEQASALEAVLARLASNVGAGADPRSAPWAGLIDRHPQSSHTDVRGHSS
jgi:MarR family transcriptional regulator, transcriptional regulator for hemolysin